MRISGTEPSSVILSQMHWGREGHVLLQQYTQSVCSFRTLFLASARFQQERPTLKDKWFNPDLGIAYAYIVEPVSPNLQCQFPTL